MSTSGHQVRDGQDRCPGAVAVHLAEVGGLARIRSPGGTLSVSQLGVLTRAAVELGDGDLELTSRGNVQVRALAAGAEFELGERLRAAGLLPSMTHERVRNIIASPLSGVDGVVHRGGADPQAAKSILRSGGNPVSWPWGRPPERVGDVLVSRGIHQLVRDLDAALCAVPELAALPGRFLITVDDGRGDVSGLGADIGLLARHSTEFGLLLGGTDTGLRLPVESAVSTVLAAATAFLAERTTQSSEAWRIAELPGGPASVAAHLPGTRVQPIGIPVPTPPPIGTLPGGVSVSVPLGRLTPAHASAVAANAPAGFLRVTPWRGIVLPGATDPAPLAAAGLITDPTSPWHGVTACAGKPRCAKALADVRADAASLIRGSGGVPVHWSGCSRRCGRPRGDIVDVLATGTGYEVARAGTTRIQSREQTAAAVAEARGAL